jgi:hypothetical protein
MILRDEYGEVEVRIGDLFEVKGPKGETATFSVICPEMAADMQAPAKYGNPSIWVRLQGGLLDLTDGRRIEFRPELHGNGQMDQVFLFTGELVARCVREHRLMTFDIPAPVQPPARIEKKGPRAPASNKRTEKQSPTTESLF